MMTGNMAMKKHLQYMYVCINLKSPTLYTHSLWQFLYMCPSISLKLTKSTSVRVYVMGIVYALACWLWNLLHACLLSVSFKLCEHSIYSPKGLKRNSLVLAVGQVLNRQTPNEGC